MLWEPLETRVLLHGGLVTAAGPLVVSTPAAPSLVVGLESPAPAATVSPLTIIGINVTNLAITGANSLLASFNLSGQILGQPVTLHNLQLPVTLASVGQTNDGRLILNLSFQIPDLNIDGLHFQLDNCSGGPATIAITATPSTEPGGGLLGDLFSSVGPLLSGPGGLLNLGSQSGSVTSGLTSVLNNVLGALVSGGPAGAGGDAAPAGTVQLATLHTDPTNGNLLGLQTSTSQVCLLAYADPSGGQLGDLFSSLNNLVNNNGNNARAQQILVRNILKEISSLES